MKTGKVFFCFIMDSSGVGKCKKLQNWDARERREGEIGQKEQKRKGK
jgi:hypothetical protein